MANQSITINFSNRTVTSDNGLIMEQKAWEGTGKVTKLDLVRVLRTSLYGGSDPITSKCGLNNDWAYLSGLYIYPFDLNLGYDVGLTHGVLGVSISQTVEVRELVNFSLEDEQTVKYPVQTLVSHTWADIPWDSSGSPTTPLSISTSNNKLLLSQKVYGTVIVEYITVRHARTLTVLPRSDVENIYDSYAWARWNGGVKLLKLEPPEGAEENFFNLQDCFTRCKIIITPRDPDDPDNPVAPPVHKTVNIDYCTQGEM